MRSCLILEHRKDLRDFSKGKPAISTVLCGLRPWRADPIPLQEIIHGLGRVGAEDGVGLEDQKMFCGREDRRVEVRIGEHLGDRFAV